VANFEKGVTNMTSESKPRGWLSRAMLFVVLALSAGYLAPYRAFAGGQAAGGVSSQSQTRRPYARPSLDARVSLFAKNLDLNVTQQSAVKKILEQQQQQILRIRDDASISGSARISQFRALQEFTVMRIRAVLTEEQRQKYDPLAPRRIPAAPGPSVEDWIKATTKPQ
jgi:hypothetical protein